MSHLITLHDLHVLRRLPRWRRLAHPRTIRHISVMSIGIVVMYSGSSMALMGHSQVYLPHAWWDMMAYFIHGVGGLPILKHVEPLWEILSPAKMQEIENEMNRIQEKEDAINEIGR